MNSKTLHTLAALPAAICIGAALGACASTGTGMGTVASSGEPVTFAWQGKDPANGTLTATLADGRTFSGTFTQLAPRGYLGGWVKDTKDYGDRYSERLAARLQAGDGSTMGCLFQLDNFVGGIGEGAKGECRLEDQTIQATIPRSLPPGV